MNSNHCQPWRRWVALASALVPAVALAAVIDGTSGPDTLEGTPGADTINGRGGDDVMMGLAGNDTYVVGQEGDQVLEAVGDGRDTVKATVSFTLPIYVENLVLQSGRAINGTGNDLNNRLTGNAAKNTLNGRAGSDRMIGRDGNDTYVVDSKGDAVIEVEGEGIDTVRASISYTQRANVENLTLTGSAAINGTGNELANSIRGNSARNVLRGMEGDDALNGSGGDDRLLGGPGNDTLTGGTGADEFQFDEALDTDTNRDDITDFNPAEDVMRLIGEVFPTLATETLPASAFALGTAAGDAATRILYDQATGFLRYDADGNGPVAAVRFARLLNKPALTGASFNVVDPVAQPETPVDYATEIQPIFTERCLECHIGNGAPHGLELDEGKSYAKLVNVNSDEVPTLKLVKPNNPDDSYLVQKVEGTAAVGVRMPQFRTPLTEDQIALIRRWITEGADP